MSPVVAVVIVVVAAAPPGVKLHPPKVYPVRVVEVVLARDAVEIDRESDEALVEASVAVTEVAKVLPSKMIVGVAASAA